MAMPLPNPAVYDRPNACRCPACKPSRWRVCWACSGLTDDTFNPCRGDPNRTLFSGYCPLVWAGDTFCTATPGR